MEVCDEVQEEHMPLFLNTTISCYITIFAGAVKVIAKIIQYASFLFPNYALAKGFADIGTQTSIACLGLLPSQTCDPPSAFSWKLGGAPLVYLLCSIPVCVSCCTSFVAL